MAQLWSIISAIFDDGVAYEPKAGANKRHDQEKKVRSRGFLVLAHEKYMGNCLFSKHHQSWFSLCSPSRTTSSLLQVSRSRSLALVLERRSGLHFISPFTFIRYCKRKLEQNNGHFSPEYRWSQKIFISGFGVLPYYTLLDLVALFSSNSGVPQRHQNSRILFQRLCLQHSPFSFWGEYHLQYGSYNVKLPSSGYVCASSLKDFRVVTGNESRHIIVKSSKISMKIVQPLRKPYVAIEITTKAPFRLFESMLSSGNAGVAFQAGPQLLSQSRRGKWR